MEDNDVVPEEFVETSNAAQNRSSDCNDDEIKKSLMQADPTKSISELARELKISSKTVLSYLRSTNTAKEDGRWIPDNRVLQCRLEICSSLVLRNTRDQILDRTVIYGEKWIYFESRKRATVWLDDIGPGPSTILETAGSSYGEKVLLTLWWSSAGLIHYHFVQGGKPMNEDKFSRQITDMYKKLQSKQPDLTSDLDVKGPILLCDNPRPHASVKSTLKLHQYGFEILPHPPHSPDLLPSNYHIFRHLNCHLAGRNFFYEVEVERAFLSFVASRRQEFFSDGVNELALRWKKCMNANGGYFNRS